MASVVRTNTNPYVAHVENVHSGIEKASNELRLDTWMIFQFAQNLDMHLTRWNAIAKTLFDDQSLELLNGIRVALNSEEDVLDLTEPEYFVYLVTQIKKYFTLVEQKQLQQEIMVYRKIMDDTALLLESSTLTNQSVEDIEEEHDHARSVYDELLKTRDISSSHAIALNALYGTDLYIAFLRLLARYMKRMNFDMAAKSAQDVLVRNARPEDLENAKVLYDKFKSDVQCIYVFSQNLVPNLKESDGEFNHNDERQLLKVQNANYDSEDMKTEDMKTEDMETIFSLLSPHTFYHLANQIQLNESP